MIVPEMFKVDLAFDAEAFAQPISSSAMNFIGTLGSHG